MTKPTARCCYIHETYPLQKNPNDEDSPPRIFIVRIFL